MCAAMAVEVFFSSAVRAWANNPPMMVQSRARMATKMVVALLSISVV